MADATTGNVASVSGGLTPVTGISKNIISAGWSVGMTISGTGIANPSSTISAMRR